MHFRFALQLGGTWNWYGRSLCQEPNQPLKILGCGRQVELLRDIPEPPQTYATKSDTQLEFGEQSLDLVPFALRASLRGSLRQLSGRLPCRFMPVNEEPPSRSASATLLYGAASTLRLRGLIKVTLCLAVHSAVAQCLALRTAKDIFDLVVLKLVTSEVSMRLVASIDHRDIRLAASL
jgi:hypothetical protein